MPVIWASTEYPVPRGIATNCTHSSVGVRNPVQPHLFGRNDVVLDASVDLDELQAPHHGLRSLDGGLSGNGIDSADVHLDRERGNGGEANPHDFALYNKCKSASPRSAVMVLVLTVHGEEKSALREHSLGHGGLVVGYGVEREGAESRWEVVDVGVVADADGALKGDLEVLVLEALDAAVDVDVASIGFGSKLDVELLRHGSHVDGLRGGCCCEW